jgi:hypothetical protein
MKATEFIIEGVAGPKNCWPGYRKTGTQPGTGKNAGKRVNDCEKIKEQGVAEGAPIVIAQAPIDVRNPKKAPQPYRNKGDIVPDTKSPSTEKRGVKGRPGQRPMPKYDEGVVEGLHQEFDMIESIIESIADQHAIDPELVWEDLAELSDDELYVFAVTSNPINEDWQKANKRDKTDGMSQKAVNAYRRENPGSKLKTAVTTKPGKLKKGGKASKRRKSYCSRSRGQMKMHSISCAKTPDKAICKARRRWNC